MANDKQLSLSDIKGDLAQRLRCEVCTRNFNQVKATRVELDRYETKEPNSRKAVSFICEECAKEGKAPTHAYRSIGGVINEIRIEDLPETKTPATKTNTTRSRKVSGKNTKGRGKKRVRATTPTENPTAAEAVKAAASTATKIEE